MVGTDRNVIVHQRIREKPRDTRPTGSKRIGEVCHLLRVLCLVDEGTCIYRFWRTGRSWRWTVERWYTCFRTGLGACFRCPHAVCSRTREREGEGAREGKR